MSVRETVYKIRRRSDGKYSTGGTEPKFSKTGKVWRTLGQLKSHLTLVEKSGNWPYTPKKRRQRLIAFYQHCEIVRFEIREVEVGDGAPVCNWREMAT